MLASIRKNVQNLFFTVVILATIAVMAFFGFGSGNDNLDTTGPIATVNGEGIGRGLYENGLERAMETYQNAFGGQFTPEMAETFGLKTRVVQELVNYTLMSQEAKKMGFFVPDQELADQIKSTPAFQKDGKFDAALYSRYQNKAQLETGWRREIQTNKLRSYMLGLVNVSPEEARDFYKLSNAKIAIEYAKIDFKALAAKQKISQADIDKAMKLPEARFASYFDTHQDEFASKAQRKLRQIRVGFPFKASEEKKKQAKTKIDLAVQGLTPANFAEKAKQYSDDEYAQKGGDRGWVEVQSLADSIEAALASLQPNQVSPLVETDFGYFVFLIEDEKPRTVPAMASVKTQIAKKLALEDFSSEFEKQKLEKWQKMLAEGKSIASELKQYGVKFEKTEPFVLGQNYIPVIGEADAILDEIYQYTAQQPFSRKLAFSKGFYYFTQKVSFEPAKLAEFEKDPTTQIDALRSVYQNEVFGKWLANLRESSKIKLAEDVQPKEAPQQPAPPANM